MKHKAFLKQKFCVVRRVPFRMAQTDRVVWANVIAENVNGLTLLLVPSLQTEDSHSIVFAEENVSERLFQVSHCSALDVGSGKLVEIGRILKFLGSKLIEDEIVRMLERELEDPPKEI